MRPEDTLQAAYDAAIAEHPERQDVTPTPGEYVSTEDTGWTLTVHQDLTGTATNGRLTIPFDGQAVRYALAEGYRRA